MASTKKDTQAGATSTPVVPVSCELCTRPDTSTMVACDDCTRWYHFDCAHVDSRIEDVSWHCEKCRSSAPQVSPTSAHINHQAKAKSASAPASRISSRSRERKQQVLIQQLEEEKKLRDQSNAIYLQKKYKILSQAVESEDEEEKDSGKSVLVDRSHLTQRWVDKINFAAPTGAHVPMQPSQEPERPLPIAGVINGQPDPCTPAPNYEVPIAPPNQEPICSNPRSPPINVLSPTQLATRHAIPKELPLFNGFPEEWPVFISSFEQSTSLAGFSDAENLLRLQRCLRGRALDAVKNRLLLPTMVPEVIRTLRMLFGRPEHILHSMIAKAKNQAPPRADKMETLIEYALAIKNVCATMEASNMTAHLNNPTLLKEFVDKLTPHLLLNWAIFSKTLESATLNDFSSWLYEIAEAACTVTTLSAPNSFEKRSNKRGGHLCAHARGVATQSSSAKDCFVCQSSHSVDSCDQFRRMDRSQRWSIVRQLRLCHICLGKHPHSRCSVSMLCGVEGCNLRHNPLLHRFQLASEAEYEGRRSGDRCVTPTMSGRSGQHSANNFQGRQPVDRRIAPATAGCSGQQSTNNHQGRQLVDGFNGASMARCSGRPSVYNNQFFEGCHTNEPRVDFLSVLFRIIPVTLYGNGQSIDTFAFLDGGSSLTLLDDELAHALDLPGRSEELCLRWTSDTTRVERDSRIVSLTIAGRYEGSQKYRLRDVRTVQNLDLPTQSVCSDLLKERYPYLADLPIQSYRDAKPRILIGMDNWKLGVPLKVVEGIWSQPMATKTRLGWSIHGAEDGNGNKDGHRNFSLSINEKPSDRDLHQLVEKFFSIEDIGVRIPMQQMVSADEKRALSIMEKTCRLIDGHFEIGLLWKADEFILPDSYPMALRRFHYLEKKMVNDGQLRSNLNTQIANLLIKGYAKRLSSDEILNPKGGRVWYLPIFVVRNPNKPSKIRLVWDAAASCNGKSLNDFLMKGPDQLVPITTILYGFRCGRIAVCGDIAEMFHQVRVREDDRGVQRFLWRDRINCNEPSVFEMRVMTFGATCSPCIAHYAKNRNAMNFANSHPRAVDAIINHHYVDDFIDSVNTVEEAIQLAKDVREIHSKAGFHIRNWMSNSTTVLTALEGDGNRSLDKAFGVNDNDITSTEKVLGMHWCTSADVFTYVLKPNHLNREVLCNGKVPTKREVLRILMAIFDPMGFLSHFLVFVKILLQDIWRTEIGWDEELPSLLFDRWVQWRTLLPRVSEVKIPRCYSAFLCQPEVHVQLHTFVDASENAYAAVSYFRIQYGDNTDVTIVSAKTKVAPRRPLSIPRLELQAAVLGVRLMNSICNAHTFPIQRFLWTDSKTVLSWFRTDPRKFQQFVMYRVGEILETSSISEWRWIPTKLNPADKATKWKVNPELQPTDEWFRGPSFLRKDSSQWPQMPTVETSGTEEYRPRLLQICEIRGSCNLLDVERFATWRALFRTLAWVVMFTNSCRFAPEPRPINGYVLTSTAIQHAQALLYKQAQFASYADDILRLKNNQPGTTVVLDNRSPLTKLSPFIDEKGILRMRGRIAFADYVDTDCKTPIILPRCHHITFLIVDHYHRKYHHCNHETVVNELRQKFYVANMRSLLKTVRRLCQVCKNQNASPRVPEMANLPRARLGAFFKPFSFVGVDYFGPILVTVGRRNEKRWAALFTCLTMRAVHIEIAHSLTADSCIMCLRNFMARRGIPLEIYSDNGTNFKGAERELREELKKVDLGRVANEFISANLKWKFNPPVAPHMGGAWERLVRSIKTVLYKILPSSKFSDETLRSALIEVESIINSRPLTFVSLECADDEALTPNHFLLGTSNGSKPPCDPEVVDMRKSWRRSQVIADAFWKRWVKAFLPTLNRRSKWFQKVKPIAKGDLVIITDNNLPRNCWPKGVVVDTVTAMDGQVRRAKVKTSNGIYERPSANLAVLDVAGPDEQSKADADRSQLTGGGMLAPSQATPSPCEL